MGAKVVNNEIVPATNGGTTIFGDANFIEIRAGGGGGGKSPEILQNGILAMVKAENPPKYVMLVQKITILIKIDAYKVPKVTLLEIIIQTHP